jgi:hypothetical protein
LKKFIAGLCAALTALQPFAAIAQQYPSVMREVKPIKVLLPVSLFGDARYSHSSQKAHGSKGYSWTLCVPG